MLKKDFQKIIQAEAGKTIDPKTQQMLSTPWSDPKTALNAEEKAFLENLIARVTSGDINLLSPGSILNAEVFDKLPSEKKSQAEVFVNATLALIRRVHDFYHNPFDNNSDMMIDMVKDLMGRVRKLEGNLGDVLKL